MPSIFNRAKFLSDNPGRFDYADDPVQREGLRQTHPNYFTEQPKTTTPAATPMEADSSSDTRKRTHTGQQSSAHQPSSSGNVAQGTADSTSTNALAADQAMPLTGTGKEQASGGGDSSGQMVHYVDRPYSNFGKKLSTYRKCHQFMSFGFAYNIINGTNQPTGRFMSTHLAEIPWHIPAFYLNQSEFDLLPIGSHCTAVRVTVTYRGSTIQFSTAQSGVNLATLNQINNITVGHALNKTGWGSNAAYASFDSANNQPMIPLTLKQPLYFPVAGQYRGMIQDYYGENNNSANFATFIPKHQMGAHTFLYNYWIQSTRAANAAAPFAATDMSGGWAPLAEKVQRMDGKTVINQVVAHSEYIPKQGSLKTPLSTTTHGLQWPNQGGTINVPTMGSLPGQRNAGIAQDANVGTDPNNTGLKTTVTETVQPLSSSQAAGNTFTYGPYNPIEKSQFLRSGYWGQTDSHIQPSLHVGVQPVPSLDSSATLVEEGGFDAWTNVRAYWDVTCEMDVVEHQPTAYPYAIVPNVPLGEQVLVGATIPGFNTNPAVGDTATIAGLYPTTSLVLP